VAQKGIEVHRFANGATAVWEECGQSKAAKGNTDDAVAALAADAGVYRARTSTKEPWRFFYVDEDGSVRDSGAASRID
jgi:hypothetical protein